MKHPFYPLILLLAISTLFFSCSRTQLQPCCRFKPGYGGFERFKKLKLPQDSISDIALYSTSPYVILLHKQSVLKRLDPYLKNKTDGNGKDILDLATLTLDNRRILSKMIAKEINRKKVIILNTETGEKIKTIQRRKYNYQNGPRSGGGGIEYIDPVKDYVILSFRFWVS